MTVDEVGVQTFVDFEQAAWTRMAPLYHDCAGRITRQAVAPLLEAARIRQFDVLLDIATGPGYVAAAARERGARVVGLDFSPEMIAVARANHPGLRFDHGDAESLPYEHGSFDIATCAFGLLHFPRPGRAVAEAYRVLRPRGRFVFTVWCGPDKVRLFGTIGGILQKFADPQAARLPAGPGAYMLSDPLVCRAVMDAAGFADVEVEEIPCHFDLDTPADIVAFLRKCSPRALPLFEAQSAEVKARIERALEEAGVRFVETDGGRIACPVLVVRGVRKGAPSCPSS